jgi:hypothetical protein
MEFPMPAFIAFSGNRGDHIHVEGDLAAAVAAMSPAARVSGMARLTQIAGEGHKVQPTTVYVNPERIAYFREAEQSSYRTEGV